MTKPGRKRTGTIERHGDHWDVRPTLADGQRGERVCQPLGMSEAKARAKAAALTELAARKGATLQQPPSAAKPAPAPGGPTLSTWTAAWCADREARGLTSVNDDRGRLRKWILPRLDGSRPVATFTTEDLERFVEDLDERVRGEELSWKTAKNVWGLVSKMFSDAARSKASSLRVRKDNPARDIRGPDEGVRRSKTYLYPSEFLALMNCEEIPLDWRQIIAIQIYTYTRAGELEALGVEDVDLAHRIVHVHRAIDRNYGGTKGTKTGHARRFAVEPELLPLVALLVRDARAARRTELVRAPRLCKQSERLRRYLRQAGVTRAELFIDDKTRKNITWHDLRATGLTWMAIRGDDPQRIMHRAGHEDMATTMLYVREADGLSYLRSEVFPPLPSALILPDILPGEKDAKRQVIVSIGKTGWVDRDSNPTICEDRRGLANHGPNKPAITQPVSARIEDGRAEFGQNSVAGVGDPERIGLLVSTGRAAAARSVLWDVLDAQVDALEERP